MQTWLLLILLTTGGDPDFSGTRPLVYHGPQVPVVLPGFTSLEACHAAAKLLLRNEYLRLSVRIGPYQCVPMFSEP